jgi:hypothetical protein
MKRKKRFNWAKPFLIISSIAVLTPFIAHAIPTNIKAIFQTPEPETKQNVKIIQEVKSKKVEPKKAEVTKPVQTPAPTPTLIPFPIPLPTIEAAISCNITDVRPPNSKWIYKDKLVGVGVRYTTDIYQLNTKPSDTSKTYYYILHDKINRNAKTKVVGNFAIAYQKQKLISKTPVVNDKPWEVEFKGCGLDAKGDKSVPLVSIFDNEEMLKSMKLIGIQQVEKVGKVQKPTTNIRVLNELDLTESK